MNKLEAQQRILEIEQRYQSGQLSKKGAIKEMKQVECQIKKTKKMTREEKKELAHKIIKIILEVLLQIITLGLPTLIGNKTILKHK